MLKFNKMLLRHVNVVPMDKEHILYDQDVLIEDETIRFIGPSDTVAFHDEGHTMEIVDCEGRYLMPSLHDCHVHVGCGDDLEVFLSYGITTVLNMMGAASHLKWREEVRSGKRLGCDIFTSGPIIDGVPYYVSFMEFENSHDGPLEKELYPGVLYQQGVAPAATPDEARRAVRYTKAAGFDFVKIYNNIGIPVYRALAEEARLQSIRVIGHFPDCVSMDYPELGPRGDLYQYSVDHVSSINIGDLPKLKNVDAWMDPTLAVESVFFDGTFESPAYQKRISELNHSLIESWEAGKDKHMAAYKEHPRGVKVIRRGTEYYGKVIRKYIEMGGKIISGTDGAMDYLMTGYSLHLELDQYIGIGLTPYETLLTSTRNASEFLGTNKSDGTVETGKRARLILTDGDPLQDISCVHEFAAVIKDNVMLTRKDCDNIREKSVHKTKAEMEFA